MNTGGAFNDRSIHTMNACGFVFSFIIIWQCETTVLIITSFVFSSLRDIESYCDMRKAYQICISIRRSGERNRSRSSSGQIPENENIFYAIVRVRFSLLRPRSEREKKIVSFLDFRSRIYRAHEIIGN